MPLFQRIPRIATSTCDLACEVSVGFPDTSLGSHKQGSEVCDSPFGGRHRQDCLVSSHSGKTLNPKPGSFPKIRGTLMVFRLHNRDYRILGSTLGFLHFGELPLYLPKVGQLCQILRAVGTETSVRPPLDMGVFIVRGPLNY